MAESYDPVLLIVVLGLLGMVPFLAIMATSFVKIVVVLTLVRNALGIQQIPPTMALSGLAMILTVYIMAPIGIHAYDQLADQELTKMDTRTLMSTLGTAVEPFRDFLDKHGSDSEKAFKVINKDDDVDDLYEKVFKDYLELMVKHGLMDATIKATGDLHIDDHHTVEDLGITFGQTIKAALGDMKGIRRYGAASVPMDETIANVSLDISGRPHLVYNVSYPKRSKIKSFDVDLVEDFLQALVSGAGITLHVNVPYGRNTHHMVEAIFKSLGRALREAVSIDPRVKGVPSTKGKI